jgi:PEGA domain
MQFRKCFALLPAAVVLFPAGLLQGIMPPQPAKLAIYSEPPGAVVTINGHQMQQHTNATFSVSAGTYQISVVSLNPRFSCPVKVVSVVSGQTDSFTCTPSGWK